MLTGADWFHDARRILRAYSPMREETVMPKGKGRIGMSSRICETNGRLPNSKRTREDERR